MRGVLVRCPLVRGLFVRGWGVGVGCRCRPCLGRVVGEGWGELEGPAGGLFVWMYVGGWGGVFFELGGDLTSGPVLRRSGG